MSRVGSNTDDVSHRTDEPALQRIPNLKEFFVAIPIVTTLIAVLYDVGYFIGVDPSYFSFFSLSEHTLFFFMAMPFALILPIVGFPLGAALLTLFNRFFV